MDAPPVQYVKTSDGYDIACAESGSGRQLVLMPSPFSNFRQQWGTNSFRPRFESLAADFTLIQYDSRGEGMSSRGLSEELLLDHFETDLEAVLARFQREPVILCAPVVSGQVAVRYAARQPETLSGLVLFQTNLDDPLEGVRYLEGLARESWENFLKIPAYNFYRLDPPTRALAILRETMLPEDFLRHMRLAPTSIRDLLPSIRVPTLVIAIQGAYGPRVSGEEEGQALAALIPSASLLLVRPEELDLASAIAEFVESIPRPGGRLADRPPLDPTVANISPREIEVLRLLARGRSNREIADELSISRSTVQNHVFHILTKTNAANRTEAAIYARNHGIV